MNFINKVFTVLFILLVFLSCNNSEIDNSKPNIIYFLADDLGYGETGIYGQDKILTPNIDKLANNGIRFTQHYSGAPVCAPARCIFLTGKHSGHAYIRGNDEWAERGDVWNYEKASSNPQLEGQRPLPTNTITIGSELQKEGYITAIFGKWGLGAPDSEGTPNKQGFDYFYGYNCQRQAHNLYPPHLWENDKKVILNNQLVAPGSKLDSLADINNPASYSKFQQKDYAPDKIHEKSLTFLRENKDKPFFMYYASPLPHLPLQVPKEDVKKYIETFRNEEPYIGNHGYFPNKYPRATYAAMISKIDTQLGELIESLKELGIYENTIIIFSSDNGPTYLGGVDFEFFESSKPFSNAYGRTKGFVYEGGIRVPMIVSWPNKIHKSRVSNHISAFYDLMPTIFDIAGVTSTVETDGISFLPTLLNENQKQHEFLYWEFPSYTGQQAVRLGKWKGIRKNIFDGNMVIELYNLETDTLELNDVASENSEIIRQMEEIMIEEHKTSIIEKFKFKQLGDS